MNGVNYTNALILNPYEPSSKIEINAGRRSAHFKADLGLSDRALSETTYKVDISVDDSAPIQSVDIALGQTTPLDIDVTGRLRLKFVVSNPNTSSQAGAIVFGNPRFTQ